MIYVNVVFTAFYSFTVYGLVGLLKIETAVFMLRVEIFLAYGTNGTIDLANISYILATSISYILP